MDTDCREDLKAYAIPVELRHPGTLYPATGSYRDRLPSDSKSYENRADHAAREQGNLVQAGQRERAYTDRDHCRQRAAECAPAEFPDRIYHNRDETPESYTLL